MTITIDATPGSLTANCYVTLEEATAFFASRLHSSNWPTDVEVQKAALITATNRLNALVWGGMRSSSTQSLAWPRQMVSDNDGYFLSGIPAALKKATCELAYFMCIRDTADTANPYIPYDQMKNLKSINIDGLAYNFRDDLDEFPTSVETYLSALGTAYTGDSKGITGFCL